MLDRSCRLYLALAAALASSFGAVELSKAQEPTRSLLVIEPLAPIAVGDPITITFHLTTLAGVPIPYQQVKVYLDSWRSAWGTTDWTGSAAVPFPHELRAGSYVVHAAYFGAPDLGLEPASNSVDLVVEQAEILIQTVPSLAGIRFALGESVLTTDASGTARTMVEHTGPYQLEVLPLDPVAYPGMRVEFSRWNDELYETTREIRLPLGRTVEAGFTIGYQVQFQFVDQADQAIDPGRISSMTLGNAGGHLRFEDTGPHWLPGNRLILRIGTELHSLDASYTAQSVMIDGSNVVNPGQQRIDVQEDTVWQIRLFLHTARFSARDALFHFPIGRGVLLEYPNERTETFPFEANGEVEVAALARGSYEAEAYGGGGISPAIPFALSRDQEVELLVISRLDIAVLLGLPLGIALALLVIGRPHLFEPLRGGLARRAPPRARTGQFQK